MFCKLFAFSLDLLVTKKNFAIFSLGETAASFWCVFFSLVFEGEVVLQNFVAENVYQRCDFFISVIGFGKFLALLAG